MSRHGIRVLTLIEASSVAGPARTVLEFAASARNPQPGSTPVDVIIVSYARGSDENALVAAAKERGLTAFTISERYRFDTGALQQLEHIVQTYKPDIIESRNIKSHLFVRMLRLHRRFPWVVWNHGYTATNLLDRAYTQIDRWSLGPAFRAVAVCKPFALRLQRRGISSERIAVMHNFVKPYVQPPAEDVERARRDLGIGNEPVILTVGRLSYEKAHADLLRAAALLRESGAPEFRIVLIGDGPQREELRRLASRLQLDKNLVMAGYQKNVNPFYALSTIFALPSYSEGSPNVVLEAMAAGVPIAATSVGGVPEIVENEVTGLIVPPRDPASMARALKRLLSDDALRARLADAAKEQVRSVYTIENYTQTLASFYEETLQAMSVGSL